MRSSLTSRALDRYRRPDAAVCPECGYPVGSPDSDRCSECGTPYPGPWKSRLRWGRRRLPVERRRRYRRWWLVAWVQTLLFATFCPGCAASRTAVPDRGGRYWLIAVVNLLGASFLLTLLSTRSVYLFVVYKTVLGEELAGGGHWSQAALDAASRVATETPLVWSFLICWGIWFAFLALCVASGMAVANLVVHRRRAGRRLLCRWSLLSTAVFAWIGLISLVFSLPAYIYLTITPIQARFMAATQPAGFGAFLSFMGKGSTWLFAGPRWCWLGTDLAPGLWLVLLVYGTWFTIGAMFNPHRDRNRRVVVAISGGSLFGIWWIYGRWGLAWAQLLGVL